MYMTDTRTHILQSASTLIGRRGYADISMADIASDVGIAKSSLYHFFSDKEALLVAVMMSYIQDAKKMYTYTSDDVPSRESLAKILDQGISYGIEHGGLVLSFEHITWSPERMEIIGQAFKELHAIIIETLAVSGVSHPEFCVHMILDMGYAYVKRAQYGYHTMTQQEFITHLITHCYA